ncbi:DUF5954 family protein [Streptomyces misionensis]|uniref:DUF5954 family protein n=1 Tax=Streptomyces misionensis TaxID=67331 RepID=UPI0033FFABB9
MDPGDVRPGALRPVVVRVPVEPVEAAMEADAADAVLSAGEVAVRGPLFGVVAQCPEDGLCWRVVVPVTAGFPQMSRDSLNSLLWFRAKDEAKDRVERRALLAAVARLETEPVNELTVLGTRYRVVRAEEYAGSGANGIEPPRPTDPEPLVPDWSLGPREPLVDADLVLDPDAPLTPAGATERLALRNFVYAGSRFPDHVIQESRRALRTHPDVLLLPTTFAVVERDGRGWEPVSRAHPTAHAARRSLDFFLTWLEPRTQGLLPVVADRKIDARTEVARNPDAPPELAAYAEASDRLRTGRCNELEVFDTTYRIIRSRRMLRWGADGPEGPRPSDTGDHAPERIHPVLDEDGVVHHDEDEYAEDEFGEDEYAEDEHAEGIGGKDEQGEG